MTTVAEPTAELIREELAKVLVSQPFARGEKLCRFLRFVVEETLAGRTDTLKEYNIGVKVYERRPDYDTRTDATVRVEAGRLRTKLIEYYAGAGAASPIRIELPKGSYVPRFVDAAPVVAAPVAARKRRPWLALAVGGATLAAAAGYWMLNEPATKLAIAPVVPLDGNSAGAQELEQKLAELIPKRAGWRVVLIAGASDSEIRANARKVNATYLLISSTNQGRVTATLSSAESGFRLWSRVFENPEPLAIADALRQPRDRTAGPGTANPEAARVYLEAYRLLRTDPPRTTKPKTWPPHLAESLKAFEKAVALDPQFGRAWAGMAMALEGLSEWDDANGAELAQRSQDVARKALAIDDTIAEAHRMLGSVALFRTWNQREAMAHLSRSAELEPANPEMIRMYAAVLSLMGRHDDAIRQASRAELMEPNVAAVSAAVGDAYFLARRHAEARKAARRAIALDPNHAFSHWLLAVNAQLDNDFDEAEREYKWCLAKYDLDSRAITGLAHLRVQQGRDAEGRKLLDDAVRRWRSERGWHASRAIILAAMGEIDAARTAIRKSGEFHEGSAPFILVDPRYDPLRTTPEYREIEKRMIR